MTGSAAMSHLFAQSLAAARLFQATTEYRDRLRHFMADKPGLAALVPTVRPITTDYTIALGVITRELAPAVGPPRHIALALPLLARTFLFHVAGQLDAMGYQFQMSRIPVTAGVRPASAGDPIRFKKGADPHPNRRRSKRRRTRGVVGSSS
jgi:uncharacterized protein (TIGR04141 family)